MMEAFDAFWKLSGFVGFLYLISLMTGHTKEWPMWILIVLSLVTAALAGIIAYLGE